MSRVLVAEDSGTILLLLRKRLELAGHEVITAADGLDALERIAAEKPEIVVLDAMMPRMSGLEVLHRMRSEGDDTPVVIASAHRDSVDLADAEELGVIALLTKPFDWDELLGAIDSAGRPGG